MTFSVVAASAVSNVISNINNNNNNNNNNDNNENLNNNNQVVTYYMFAMQINEIGKGQQKLKNMIFNIKYAINFRCKIFKQKSYFHSIE